MRAITRLLAGAAIVLGLGILAGSGPPAHAQIPVYGGASDTVTLSATLYVGQSQSFVLPSGEVVTVTCTSAICPAGTVVGVGAPAAVSVAYSAAPSYYYSYASYGYSGLGAFYAPAIGIPEAFYGYGGGVAPFGGFRGFRGERGERRGDADAGHPDHDPGHHHGH